MSALPLLLVGHGRMGRLVESLAPSCGFEVTAVVSGRSIREGRGLQRALEARPAVAIDFSTAETVPETVRVLCEARISMVIGTTGWQDRLDEVVHAIEAAGIGAVVAANFSVGAQVTQHLAEAAGRLLTGHTDYGAYIHEAHHSAKRDAPSGTARSLHAVLGRVFPRAVDVSSTRAGFIPGTHTVGFDGPAETITITHTVRDRATFARGALEAARWVVGRQGVFGMRDVLEQDRDAR